MKFRIKGRAFVKPSVMEFESSDATILDLKRATGTLLQLEEKDWLLLNLSMNGKTTLATDNSQTIVSAGFVPGDTIFISGAPTECTASRLESTISLQNEVLSIGTSCVENTTHTQIKTNVSITRMVKEIGHHFPLPLAEVDIKQGANQFTELMTENPLHFKTNFEKFCGLLHILMVEVGFIPVTGANRSCNPYKTLPHSWNVNKGTLKLSYTSSYPPHASCVIVMQNMGPIVFIYGQSQEKTKISWKVKLGEYVAPQPQNLSKLSIEFKNHFAFPLFVTVQRECQGVCPFNLTNLPPEITLQILKKLDPRSLCRLSQTSSQFKELVDHPKLWKELLTRDFGDVKAAADSNWKQVYRNSFREAENRKRARSEAFRPIRMPDPIRPEFPFGGLEPPFPHPYPVGGDFPSMVGGDDDLHPNLEGLDPRRRRFGGLPAVDVEFRRHFGRNGRGSGGGFPFF